ncbi:MAG: ATP-dependent protease ATPase subunit HslU, partial [Deltaproteobacteria bacterium]|nr:ATP-dependent protease ATPase subunit HslU [Deltaproteobacteria bacterium]
MKNLTPREIVQYLDKYIVGQDEAKKAIAIALRTHYRRQLLSPEIKEEVTPKNILMIGPTGTGKTEIARRIAKLVNAPFVKVEASKFTEVGYVGRDVESMVRDLARVGMEMVRKEEFKRVEKEAEQAAEERILDALIPPLETDASQGVGEREKIRNTREKFRDKLRKGELDEKTVEIYVNSSPSTGPIPMVEIFTPNLEELDANIKDMLGNFFPKRKKKKKVKVKVAREILKEEEAQRLVDNDKILEEAKRRVEERGIIFIDEIDKIAGKTGGAGPDISREGVQRDILPIVEGSVVNTRCGAVHTDHILFIAAGSFHQAKPSDLIPELQGRFPIRVELKPLKKEDFVRILTEPENALIKQYVELLKVDGVRLSFKEDAIEKIAEFAAEVNEKSENIGARRLHTILEKLLEDISFNTPSSGKKDIVIDAQYVEKKLSNIVDNRDLSKYI